MIRFKFLQWIVEWSETASGLYTIPWVAQWLEEEEEEEVQERWTVSSLPAMGWGIVRVFYWQTSERQDQVEKVWMSLMDCKAFLEAAYSPMQPHYNPWGWNYILKSMYLHGSIFNVFNGYTHFIHCLSYFVYESQFATVGYTQMATATMITTI